LWPGASDKAQNSFVGLREEVLDGMPRAGDEKAVSGLVQYLHEALGHILAIWTFRAVLLAHERKFNTIRDELASPESRSLRAGRRLRRLQREILPLSFDLETLERGARDREALGLMRGSAETRFVGVAIKLNEDKELPSPGDDLVRLLIERIGEEGQRVADAGRAISTATRVQGELLLAMTNVRLQWMVLVLTLLIGAAGLYATTQAA
jgi:hypothetical protein